MFTFLLLAAAAGQPATHEDSNPLYKSLVETGFSVGADAKAKLSAPTMPDGLDAAKQSAIIKKLIGEDIAYNEFVREGPYAPELLKLRDVTPSDPKAPARGVDVWFVAYGDLKALDDNKFLERLVNTGRGDGKGKGLTKEDLAKRKITLTDEKREAFGYIEFDFLEKVHLKATGRVVWTRNADSVIVAGELDSRFTGDAEFPNEWQSIIKEGGESKLGPKNPWANAAFYLKFTKLAEPAGALFCEQHVIFAEPTGWFDGANLLRSKLPTAVKVNIRTMRKEWAKQK